MKRAITANRNYKDSVFRLLFRDREQLLSLYNAVNGTAYTDAGALQINTLENAIYIKIKNDISFILYAELSLYEHQASVNPNMPLRYLFYVADVLKKVTEKDNLYAETGVVIPEPRFYIFYNGKEPQPERVVYRLSEMYEKDGGRENRNKKASGKEACDKEKPALELTVVQLNINAGYNEELKKQCKTLAGYMCYVDKVRQYQKETASLSEAVDLAITDCIRENILAEFFREQRAEVRAMSIYEFDEEKFVAAMMAKGERIGREEGERIGREEGERIGLQAGQAERELLQLEIAQLKAQLEELKGAAIS